MPSTEEYTALPLLMPVVETGARQERSTILYLSQLRLCKDSSMRRLPQSILNTVSSYTLSKTSLKFHPLLKEVPIRDIPALTHANVEMIVNKRIFK